MADTICDGVQDNVVKDFTSAWNTEEWKRAKKELLKDTCDQCGSSENLVLMHTWRPPKPSRLRQQIKQEWVTNKIKNNTLKELDATPYTESRLACPECNSVNIRKRKTMTPPYKCNRCDFEFNNPTTILVLDDFAYQKAYKVWIDEVCQDDLEKIEGEFNKRYQEYQTKYRSGEGTVTFCRKCQFLWTQKGMKLCQTCKSHYHSRRYEQCYECNTKENLILCEKCNATKIHPQPGGLNICESCYEKMWDEEFG